MQETDQRRESRNEATPEEAVHLLVVDDEEDMESLFRLRFRRDIHEGRIEFRFFNSPSKALAAVDEDPLLEIIITDLNMPELHGLDLIERVETMRRPLKVIVLTAYGDIQNIRAAMMRGAFDFLMKPLDVDDLRATLSKAVAITRQLKAGDRAEARAQELTTRNRFVEDVFGRHVSKDVMKHLLASPSGQGISERREVTFLMADIRGFSHLAESMTPEDSVAVLNGYLDVATEVILSHNGTIIEILGDGLLVFFGAPVADEKAPEHAAHAALELMQAMDALNERHRSLGYPKMAIGIGIHTGEAVVGTIGSSQRQKYAALGRSVNLVARIEDQTLAGQVLVSDATHDALGDLAVTRGDPAQMRVKGFASPVTIRDLTGLRAPYDIALPNPFTELTPHEPPTDASIALVINNRIARTHPAAIISSSPEALRLRTELITDVFDELVVIDGQRNVFGKVREIDQSGELLLAVTSVSHTNAPST